MKKLVLIIFIVVLAFVSPAFASPTYELSRDQLIENGAAWLSASKTNFDKATSHHNKEFYQKAEAQAAIATAYFEYAQTK